MHDIFANYLFTLFPQYYSFLYSKIINFKFPHHRSEGFSYDYDGSFFLPLTFRVDPIGLCLARFSEPEIMINASAVAAICIISYIFLSVPEYLFHGLPSSPHNMKMLLRTHCYPQWSRIPGMKLIHDRRMLNSLSFRLAISGDHDQYDYYY